MTGKNNRSFFFQRGHLIRLNVDWRLLRKSRRSLNVLSRYRQKGYGQTGRQ
jgi:hypothetical protein